MKKQVRKELINSWEWLDSFCLTQRGDCKLACGQHGIVIVEVKQFEDMKKRLPKKELDDLIDKIDKYMETYALEDTIVAKYNEYTYAVVLHFLEDRNELKDMCKEIEASLLEAKKDWDCDINITIGAAECHHDPEEGYKCAARLAMEALQEARNKNKDFILAPDTLRPHPLAVKMKKGNE